jgi:hypothetical protein
MKRFFIAILSIALFSGAATADINWITTNQITVHWDAVTTLENGDALPAGDVIRYLVYAVEYPDGDRSAPVVINDVDTTDAVITLSSEGKYIWGVRPVRFIEGELVSQGGISWSDDTTKTQDGGQIGIQHYIAPMSVGGLR